MRRNKSRVHVGMILHGYYLSDPRVRREAEALSEAGFEVEVFCLRAPHNDAGRREPVHQMVEGVRITRLPIERKRGGFARYVFEYASLTFLAFFKLAWSHMGHPFDVIHVHNMPDILVVAGLVPKLAGAKLILDVHDPMVEHYRATYHIGRRHLIVAALRLQERIAHWMADKIFTVSETMRQVLESKGIAKEKVFVLHNFPDNDKFPMKVDRKGRTRSRKVLTLLYCGTVTEHYRLDIALQALHRASQRIPGLRLKILGAGNTLTNIQHLAKELGVEDRIEYLKPVAVDKVREVMAGADVAISTHQAGIFGDLYFSTKILESMTQGLPVISSRTRTIQRYIPEDAIFYFEPGNVDDLVTQIITISEQPKLVRKRRLNALNILKRYTWESEAQRLLNVYRELTI